MEDFKKELSTINDVPFMELINENIIATIKLDRFRDIFSEGNQANFF